MRLKAYHQIPPDWKVLTVRKKTTVTIRPSKIVEKFKVSWSDSELTSDPEKDVIVIMPNGSEYPCKYTIFKDTYEDLSSRDKSHSEFRSDMSPFSRIYRKKGTSKIVEIPHGVELTIETLEGDVFPVAYPDYIAVGVEGELYPNKKEFVDENLEIL